MTLLLWSYKNVQTIDKYAFYNCPYLRTVEFLDCEKIEEIGLHAFYDCPVSSIVVPDKYYEKMKRLCNESVFNMGSWNLKLDDATNLKSIINDVAKVIADIKTKFLENTVKKIRSAQYSYQELRDKYHKYTDKFHNYDYEALKSILEIAKNEDFNFSQKKTLIECQTLSDYEQFLMQGSETWKLLTLKINVVKASDKKLPVKRKLNFDEPEFKRQKLAPSK